MYNWKNPCPEARRYMEKQLKAHLQRMAEVPKGTSEYALSYKRGLELEAKLGFGLCALP